MKKGDAILKDAQCDAMTGAPKDGHYRRAESARAKRLGPHRRMRQKQLGKFGAASAVRTIAPTHLKTKEPEGAHPPAPE